MAPYALLKQRFTLSGEVRATYALGNERTARRRDLANYEKATSDLLVKWGILSDDSQIVDIRLHWADDVEPGMVRVVLEEAT